MAEFLGKAFLSFLLVLGAVEAVRLVVFALLRTRKKGKVCFLLTFHGHEEEAEMALRAAVQRLKWMGGREEKQVLCLDCGMDEETRRICEAMAREYDIIELCPVCGPKQAE